MAALIFGLMAVSASATGLKDAVYEDPVSIVAFGSCNKPWRPQVLWSTIKSMKPDAFMWTGDAVYTNGSTMAHLEKSMQMQINNHNYTTFINSGVKVIGAIDDHDYGVNDAGKDVENREERIQRFVKFIQDSNPRTVPESIEKKDRDGLYSLHTFGPPSKQVKLILLDTRTHRDPYMLHLPYWFTRMKWGPVAKLFGTVNTILRLISATVLAFVDNAFNVDLREDGDMLGEEQWKWLEKSLEDSEASFHVIVSSVQVWTTNPFVESWGHFPNSRRRLAEMLAKHKPKGLLLLSGDVHFAELIKGYRSDTVEVTSSGMTHVASKRHAWIAPPKSIAWLIPPIGSLVRKVIEKYGEHRARKEDYFVDGFNFGTFEYLWDTQETTGHCPKGIPVMYTRVRNEDAKEVLSTTTCGQSSIEDWEKLDSQRRLSVDPYFVFIIMGLSIVMLIVSIIALRFLVYVVKASFQDVSTPKKDN